MPPKQGWVWETISAYRLSFRRVGDYLLKLFPRENRTTISSNTTRRNECWRFMVPRRLTKSEREELDSLRYARSPSPESRTPSSDDSDTATQSHPKHLERLLADALVKDSRRHRGRPLVRTVQVCDRCRHRKVKCDGQLPCGACQTWNERAGGTIKACRYTKMGSHSRNKLLRSRSPRMSLERQPPESSTPSSPADSNLSGSRVQLLEDDPVLVNVPSTSGPTQSPVDTASWPTRVPFQAPGTLRRPHIAMMLQQVFSKFGVVEEPLKEGHQRIRWTCRCGKSLYDDYTEFEGGSLDKLEEHLKQSANSDPRDPDSQSSHASESVAGIQVTAISGSHQSSNISASSSRRQTDSPFARRSGLRQPRRNYDTEMQNIAQNASRLMCCVEGGRFAVDLHQEVLHNIHDDVNLFVFLRKTYHERRGNFRQYWSLRGLSKISLVRFSYGGPRWVDIRKHENDCLMNQKCECLPPKALIGIEYSCDPVPPKYYPPIGQRLMRHLYDCPMDAGSDSTRILSQFPKRICGELAAESHEQIEAWGIVYEEGWNWPKIWWALGLVFFMPSVLFGMLWGVLRKDIQGAFGVASWWMIGAMIMLGITGAQEQFL